MRRIPLQASLYWNTFIPLDTLALCRHNDHIERNRVWTDLWITLVSEAVFYCGWLCCARVRDRLHWVLSRAEVDPISFPGLLCGDFNRKFWSRSSQTALTLSQTRVHLTLRAVANWSLISCSHIVIIFRDHCLDVFHKYELVYTQSESCYGIGGGVCNLLYFNLNTKLGSEKFVFHYFIQISF